MICRECTMPMMVAYFVNLYHETRLTLAAKEIGQACETRCHTPFHYGLDLYTRCANDQVKHGTFLTLYGAHAA